MSRQRALLAESVRVAWASRVTSGMVLLLAAIVPAAILGTAGLSIEAQRSILRRVDEAGARIITMTTTGGATAVIPAPMVERVAALEGVSWVVGLGPVSDGRNHAPTGGPTPVRAIRSVRAPVAFSGQTRPGAAYVSGSSAARLGIAGAYSVVEPGPVPVAGWFRASDPLGALDAFVLIPSVDDDALLERLIIAVEDVSRVDPVADVLDDLAGSDAAQATTIDRGAGLLAARAAVQDEVAARDRLLVIALLAVAMIVVGVVVLVGTLGARRDFGRRRALGATQEQLMILVLASTLWPALIGGLAGTLAGAWYLTSRLGVAPDWRFPASIGILAVLACLGAAAIPAVIAATRDPLRVLRVP